MSKDKPNYAFIDSQNLNLGVQSLGWHLDYKKFRLYLKNKYNVQQAYLFIGKSAGNQGLYVNLQHAGYNLVFKPTVAYFENGKKTMKGNVDAELVLYASAKLYDHYNRAVIVSGDGDFYCLAEYLDENKKLLRIITPNRRYSKLLSNYRRYITSLEPLQSKLEYHKGEKRNKKPTHAVGRNLRQSRQTPRSMRSIETLDQALKLGSLTSREDESLGKYGMGLITGSISMGRRLTVITKHSGEFFTAIQDLDEVVRENKFIKTVRQSNKIEIARFDQTLGGAESGTIITIQKVDNLQNKSIPQFKAKLIRDCGQIYRYFINSNKKIYINKTEVRALDPMMLDQSGTETFLDITESVMDDSGQPTDIRLRIVALPKVSDQEDKTMGLNIPNQGFYLMRNNREITSGESFGVYTKHNDYNRFRAEIFVSGDLDRKIGINFRKQGNKLSDDIYSWIERNAYPQIKSIQNIALRDQKSKSKKVDHKGSSRVIENKASILKKPRLDKVDTGSDLEGVLPEAFTNVAFEVESNTRLAPLFQFEVKGKDLKINYNNDHPFYQQVFAEIRDNPNLTSAVDFLIYSAALALVEITSSKEREHLQDEFIDRFSDNLRALLS